MFKFIYDDLKKKKILYYIITILVLFSFIAIKPNLDNTMFQNIANSISNEKLLFLCFFEISFFITFYINNYFLDNSIMKIRYSSPKKYIKKIEKTNFKFQILLLILLLMIVIIFQNIFSFQGYNFEIIEQFRISNLMYLIYKILQILFLMLILSRIIILLLNSKKERLAFIFMIMFIFFNLINFYLTEDKTLKFTFLIGNSILNTYKYSNFFINNIDYFIHIIFLITTERVINYVFYNKKEFK